MNRWGLFLVAAAFGIGYAFYMLMMQPKTIPFEGFPDLRKFQVSYESTIGNFPEGAENVRVWIPLASNREGQKILSKKINIPAEFEITTDADFGNEMIYLEFNGEEIPESLDVKVNYDVETSVESFLASNEERDLGKYLQPSRLMVIDEEVIRRATEATQGAENFDGKVRGIYNSVLNYMVYDKTAPGYGKGDTVRACEVGKGNCTDFHSLFISMSQASGIPARFKMGLPIPSVSESPIKGYHCWAEFYHPKEGWKPVDASEAWKHPERREAYFGNFDTNKFVLSVGRDITLSPKPAEAPLNIFFYPYVEVDGKEFKDAQMAFQYKDLLVV